MNALIQFFPEEVDFNFGNDSGIRQWIIDTIEAEGKNAGVINLIFCNDEYLLDLNQRFLERDTLTDVIAFDYHEDESDVSGDIFISIERIEDNADQFNQSFLEEVHRVVIHGVLHLCGYSDKAAEEKSAMTLKEDYYLSLLPH